MFASLLRHALAGLACLSLATISPTVKADVFDSTRVTVKSGTSGYWDRYGYSHPAWGGGTGHHRVTCEPTISGTFTSLAAAVCSTGGKGQWATDFYNAAGQFVRYDAVAQGGPLSAKVWAIVPTCAGGASVAGWTVFVDVYVGSSWEGWVSYSHLENVGLYVYPGLTIQPGRALGTLKRWAYSTCWQVSSDAGVHTHIEMWNKNMYACYKGYQSGVYLGGSMDLGIIGRTIYSFMPAMC